jgi:hypothetical protein
MVRLSPGASAPWVFAIDQLGRGRHGKKAYAERLIGSIRRKCVDHIVVFGERHLRHALLSYMNHYNEVRTHLSLGKDAPVSRVVHAVGQILPRPILGGLHHEYVRSDLRQGEANGARFFAYRALRRTLSCRELILASQDLTIAADRLSAPGTAVRPRGRPVRFRSRRRSPPSCATKLPTAASPLFEPAPPEATIWLRHFQ